MRGYRSEASRALLRRSDPCRLRPVPPLHPFAAVAACRASSRRPDRRRSTCRGVPWCATGAFRHGIGCVSPYGTSSVSAEPTLTVAVRELASRARRCTSRGARKPLRGWRARVQRRPRRRPGVLTVDPVRDLAPTRAGASRPSAPSGRPRRQGGLCAPGVRRLIVAASCGPLRAVASVAMHGGHRRRRSRARAWHVFRLGESSRAAHRSAPIRRLRRGWAPLACLCGLARRAVEA